MVGQYLAQTDFIQDLNALAAHLDAGFFEFVLDLDAAVLGQRLAGRSNAPSRSEHLVKNQLVGPDDAERLVESMEIVRQSRPGAIWVDARGSLASTLDLLRAALA